jgi:hypothetical protein
MTCETMVFFMKVSQVPFTYRSLETPTHASPVKASVDAPKTKRILRSFLEHFFAQPPRISYPLRPFVGELQERWEFPSDHLPVGASIDDFHLASWNVLNTIYLDWLYNNSQGLARSLIADENVPVNAEGLTKRDLHVIEDILQMIQNPHCPKSMIALQECGRPFLKELVKHLPANWQMIRTNDKLRDENVVLYNTDRFIYVADESSIVYDAFPCQMGRALQNLVFLNKLTGKRYQVFNAHLPGDPNLPGRYEFAQYVLSHAKKDAVNVALGDMNFNEEEMADAFHDVDPNHRFTNYSSYPTNVGLDFCSKNIDHVFVRNATFARGNTPNEVLSGLQQMVNLLQEETGPIAVGPSGP